MTILTFALGVIAGGWAVAIALTRRDDRKVRRTEKPGAVRDRLHERRN